jgi:hypothetical protein
MQPLLVDCSLQSLLADGSLQSLLTVNISIVGAELWELSFVEQRMAPNNHGLWLFSYS